MVVFLQTAGYCLLFALAGLVWALAGRDRGYCAPLRMFCGIPVMICGMLGFAFCMSSAATLALQAACGTLLSSPVVVLVVGLVLIVTMLV